MSLMEAHCTVFSTSQYKAEIHIDNHPLRGHIWMSKEISDHCTE